MSPKTTPSASRVSAALEERLPRRSCSGISWKGAPRYRRTAQNANLAACVLRQPELVIQLEGKSLLFLWTWRRHGRSLLEQHRGHRHGDNRRAERVKRPGATGASGPLGGLATRSRLAQ